MHLTLLLFSLIFTQTPPIVLCYGIVFDTPPNEPKMEHSEGERRTEDSRETKGKEDADEGRRGEWWGRKEAGRKQEGGSRKEEAGGRKQEGGREGCIG